MHRIGDGDPPSFSVEIERTGNETVLFVRGEIDMQTCGDLRTAISPELGSGVAIVVDLADVGFMDSSGIAVLLQARALQDEHGASFVVRNPSRIARLALSATGLRYLLPPDEFGSASP